VDPAAVGDDALHLLNSEEVQGKIARAGGRADQMVKDPRPDAEKVEELFQWALGRKPSEKHLKLALENAAARAFDAEALQQIVGELAQEALPLQAGAQTVSPPTNEAIEKLLAVAPRYGIEIQLPR